MSVPGRYSNHEELVNMFETTRSDLFVNNLKDEKVYTNPELYAVAKEIFAKHKDKPDNALVNAYTVLTSNKVSHLPSFYQLIEKRTLNNAIAECEEIFFDNPGLIIPSDNDYLTSLKSMKENISRLPEPQKSVLSHDFKGLLQAFHQGNESFEDAWEKLLSDCVKHDTTGLIKTNVEAKQFLEGDYYLRSIEKDIDDFEMIPSSESVITQLPTIEGKLGVNEVDTGVSDKKPEAPTGKVVFGIHGLDDEVYLKMSQTEPKDMKTIILKSIKAGDDDTIDEFCNYLSQCTNALGLNLEFSDLSPSQAEKIGAALEKLSNLSNLHISGIKNPTATDAIIQNLNSKKLLILEVLKSALSPSSLGIIQRKIEEASPEDLILKLEGSKLDERNLTDNDVIDIKNKFGDRIMIHMDRSGVSRKPSLNLNHPKPNATNLAKLNPNDPKAKIQNVSNLGTREPKPTPSTNLAPKTPKQVSVSNLAPKAPKIGSVSNLAPKVPNPSSVSNLAPKAPNPGSVSNLAPKTPNPGGREQSSS